MIAERVVAIVNDAIHPRERELEARMMPLMQEVNQITDQLRERERRRKHSSRASVLDDMMSEELSIVQAGEQAKIEVESERGPGRARRDQVAEQPRRSPASPS